MSPQLIVTISNEENKVFKTYHILCGTNYHYTFLLLDKNIVSYGIQDIKVKFKILCSDVDHEHLKARLKDIIVIEIREGYYLIDFESIPVLKADQYEYFKEENFDYLNDIYYDHLANSNERLSIVQKIPSRVSAVSSEYHDIDGNDISIVELAFLGKYKRKRSNKCITNEKSASIGIISATEDEDNKEDFEIVNTSLDDSFEHEYRDRKTMQPKAKQKLNQIFRTPQKSDRFILGDAKGSNENSNFESPKPEILSHNADFDQGLEQPIKINRRLSMDDVVPRNNYKILSIVKHDDQKIIMQQKLGLFLKLFDKFDFLNINLIIS